MMSAPLPIGTPLPQLNRPRTSTIGEKTKISLSVTKFILVLWTVASGAAAVTGVYYGVRAKDDLQDAAIARIERSVCSIGKKLDVALEDCDQR